MVVVGRPPFGVTVFVNRNDCSAVLVGPRCVRFAENDRADVWTVPPVEVFRNDFEAVIFSVDNGIRNVVWTAFLTSSGDFKSGLRKILVLAVNDLRHNGILSSNFFFSSANIRSFDMLRPNAIGLALALRWSGFDSRPTGLTELTRVVICDLRCNREWFVIFFSSFSDAVLLLYVSRLLADFERIVSGNRDFRVNVPESIGIAGGGCNGGGGRLSVTSNSVFWYSENIRSVLLDFDEWRFGGVGGVGGVGGKNVWIVFGNAPNKSNGRVMFVIG